MGSNRYRQGLMPRNDSHWHMFMQAFCSTIEAKPAIGEQVGLTASDIAQLGTLYRSFDSAVDVANNPATRTSDNIARKDAARDQAIERFRQVFHQIKGDYRISDSIKLTLGIDPKAGMADSRKTRIGPPTTSPLLNFMAARNGWHEFTYADSLTPDSRAKPNGVTDLRLHGLIGKSVPSAGWGGDPDSLPFLGDFTKTPFRLGFRPEQVGMMALLYGRWMTRTKLAGPWSSPLVITISMASQTPNVPVLATVP